jgi:hypothetical protein
MKDREERLPATSLPLKEEKPIANKIRIKIVPVNLDSVWF